MTRLEEQMRELAEKIAAGKRSRTTQLASAKRETKRLREEALATLRQLQATTQSNGERLTQALAEFSSSNARSVSRKLASLRRSRELGGDLQRTVLKNEHERIRRTVTRTLRDSHHHRIRSSQQSRRTIDASLARLKLRSQNVRDESRRFTQAIAADLMAARAAWKQLLES